MVETMSWGGKQESRFVIVADLWEQYIGSRTEKPENYLQQLHMLQESVRKAMRATHESYLNGKATAGLVSETKGHAVLLGKIIVSWERQVVKLNRVRCAGCLDGAHGECIGQGCYCDCQVPA